MNLVQTTLRLFKVLIDEAVEAHSEDFQKYLTSWLQVTLIYTVVWGIGGILNADSREKFDLFFRDVIKGVEPYRIPKELGNLEISLPSEGLLFDYFYIYKQKGVWKYWPEVVRRLEIEENPLGIQVPTIDTSRYIQMIELHAKVILKIKLFNKYLFFLTILVWNAFVISWTNRNGKNILYSKYFDE